MLVYIDTILLILRLLGVDEKTARPGGRTVFLIWRRKMIFILKRTVTYTEIKNKGSGEIRNYMQMKSELILQVFISQSISSVYTIYPKYYQT